MWLIRIFLRYKAADRYHSLLLENTVKSIFMMGQIDNAARLRWYVYVAVEARIRYNRLSQFFLDWKPYLGKRSEGYPEKPVGLCNYT